MERIRHPRRVSQRSAEWQYGSRSSEEVRTFVLRLVLDFIRTARRVPDVERIALIGSLMTRKRYPHDADVLVSINESIDFASLAGAGRRFKGKAQGINSGADIFLADHSGTYIGRVCHYRECHPRVACRARHCGLRPHLNDDLDVVTLSPTLIAAPPIIVHPKIVLNATPPPDVEALVLAPLRDNASTS
jgi:hypothetical protein